MQRNEFLRFVNDRITSRLPGDYNIVSSENDFAISITQGQVTGLLSLENLYEKYQRSSNGFIDALDGFIDQSLVDLKAMAHLDFTKVKNKIYPTVKSCNEFPDELIKALCHTTAVEGILSIFYVVDRDDSKMYITLRHMEDWHITERELHLLAMRNFKRDIKPKWEKEKDGKLNILIPGSNYEATHILLTGDLEKLGKKLAIGIPNDEILIALEYQNVYELSAFSLTVAQAYRESKNSLSNRLFTVRNGKLKELEV